MISRRGFFGALATAAVGACLATKIPTSFLPQPVRYRAACEYLLKKYHAHTKGLGVSAEKWPKAILVGRELYEAYESELVPMERFGAYSAADTPYAETLAFKSAMVVAHPLTGLRGWDVMILSKAQWAKARARLDAGKSLEWVSNAA